MRVRVNLEVGGARVAEDERRDGGGGQHGEAVGELDARLLLRVEQLPHEVLLGVVGLRRVAGRGPDADVLGLEQVLARELLVGRVAWSGLGLG